MKARILSCAIVLTLALGPLSVVYARSATWSTNPSTGDWNTAANWTPPSVPNGPTNTATFDVSNITSVSLSADTQVNSVVFDSGASAYTITVPSSLSLTISGTGITNNSGIPQNFVVANDFSKLDLKNNATAGVMTFFTLTRWAGVGCSWRFDELFPYGERG
jgi:hypothetical protein